MIKAHEIKLYPTKTQEIFFKKSCGEEIRPNNFLASPVKQEIVQINTNFN